MSTSPFKRRTVIILSVVVGISFIAAMLFAIFSDVISETQSAGANGFSRSALGHRGLIELLESRDVPVLVSEYDSAGKAGNGAALLVAEPLVFAEDESGRGKSLSDMLSKTPTALVVLPKWYGIRDPVNRAWLSQVELLDTDEVEPVLRALELDAAVIRPETQQVWSSTYPSLKTPPTLISPQLITPGDSYNVFPLIESQDGILLGEIASLAPESDGEGQNRLLVLSDPDVLSNHGLRRGRNAALAVAILDELRDHELSSLVVDETMHGFQREPSIWQALFEFPLAMVTIQALLAVFLLLWASMSRFGKPLPPRPAIEPGKAFLIENTAHLMRYGRHADHALARYLQTSIQDVSRALHAPYDMTPAAHRKWLKHIQSNRKMSIHLSGLEREVENTTSARHRREALAVAIAHRIYQWKQEMIHGSANRSRH